MRCYKRRWDEGASSQPWTTRHAACVRCGTTERRHAGNGLCINCYDAGWRRTPEGREQEHLKLARYNASEHGQRVRRDYAARLETKKRKWLDSLRRREQREGVWIPLPPNYEALVLDIFGHRCARCDAATALELDHHRPLQDGFPLYGNSVPLCRACNAKKHSRHPERFYEPSRLERIEACLVALRQQLGLECSRS